MKSQKAKKKKVNNKSAIHPSNIEALKKPYIDSADVEKQLFIPPRTIKAFTSDESIRRAFSLPVTLGAPKEERERLNMAFDGMGGFDAIKTSLIQHAEDLGEFPFTSFVGYGALQQIAQNGMIRACISTVADDVTRKWITITGGDETDPEIIKELQDIQESTYHLRDIFHEASITAGYMGGAFIYINTGASEKDLELPLMINEVSAELEKGTPLQFVVIDPVNVTPGDYNSDNPLRKDYMQPKWWWVLGKKIHHSRLLPIVDNVPPVLLKPSYNFLGIPQAQILWDYVAHFNNCRVYTADLLKKISLLVIQTDTTAIMGTPGGIRDFDIRMQVLQRYRDNNSVFVCDKTDEAVSNVQTTITGCTDIVRQSLEMIACINRTPAVKLLGISPSGFNATGESDLKNYYDHIKSNQELKRNALQVCLNAIQIVKYGKIDRSISFEFNELGEENASAKAMTANTKMNTLVAASSSNAISAEEMRTAIKQDPDFGLDFIPDDIPEELQGQEPQDFLNGGEENGTNPLAEFIKNGANNQQSPQSDLSNAQNQNG